MLLGSGPAGLEAAVDEPSLVAGGELDRCLVQIRQLGPEGSDLLLHPLCHHGARVTQVHQDPGQTHHVGIATAPVWPHGILQQRGHTKVMKTL